MNEVQVIIPLAEYEKLKRISKEITFNMWCDVNEFEPNERELVLICSKWSHDKDDFVQFYVGILIKLKNGKRHWRTNAYKLQLIEAPYWCKLPENPYGVKQD